MPKKRFGKIDLRVQSSSVFKKRNRESCIGALGIHGLVKKCFGCCVLRVCAFPSFVPEIRVAEHSVNCGKRVAQPKLKTC